MKQYLELLNQTLTQGARQKNRTGIDTLMIPGGMMQFDLAMGFPALTTKKIYFQAVVAELLGFIGGYTSAADFRALGCKIWDANANENKAWLANPNRRGADDLGRIYGAQWRKWWVNNDLTLDQLAKAIDTIQNDPTSRRIIVSAWRPDELDQMALPPCHLLYQFMVEQGRSALHMSMYMRSCDMFLGVPFNIASYALLLSLVAKATAYEPGLLTMFLADVHIYENHMDQVKLQLARDTRALPGLKISRDTPPARSMGALEWIESLGPNDIHLDGYDPHPPIKGEMAV